MTIEEDSEKLLLKLYKCKQEGGEMPSSKRLLQETGWDKDRLYIAMQYLIDSEFVKGRVIKGLGSTKVQEILIYDVNPSGIDKVEHQSNENIIIEKSNNLKQVDQTRNELIEESIRPASVNDQATKVDVLGFEPYVKAIADFLTNKDTKPPLTLSIEGQWGTGKSSFMLQLQEILESRKHLTVEFNAWRHDKEEALWAAFALDFIHQISQKRSFLRRWWGHLKLLIYRFSWKNGWLDVFRAIAIWILFLSAIVIVLSLLYLKGFEWTSSLSGRLIGSIGQNNNELLQAVISIGGVAGAIGIVVSLWIKLRHFVGNPLDINLNKYLQSPDYEDRLAFIEHFHKDFKKIVDAYAGKNTVYVFIDDLDRCEVPKAADLMQALNLMITDDLDLIYVIGMDREKIAASFAVKHEKLLPYLFSMKPVSDAPFRGIEYGYEFIEKFIQLPFMVPEPTKPDLQRLLDKISNSNHNIPINKAEGRFSQIKNRFRKYLTPKTISSEQIPPKLTEEQKLRRERIVFRLAGDSQTIRDIALMVAPALDNNPRRLKQFINLFRLRAFIAKETGLFDTLEDSSVEEELALQQLGKFVVISLKWPLLLVELEENPSLLSELQNVALGQVLPPPLKGNRSYWTEQQKLMDLLRSGCINDDGTRNSEREQYCSLSKLNINKLLQVSPRVVRSPMLKPEVITKSINEEQKSNGLNRGSETVQRKADQELKIEFALGKFHESTNVPVDSDWSIRILHPNKFIEKCSILLNNEKLPWWNKKERYYERYIPVGGGGNVRIPKDKFTDDVLQEAKGEVRDDKTVLREFKFKDLVLMD